MYIPKYNLNIWMNQKLYGPHTLLTHYKTEFCTSDFSSCEILDTIHVKEAPVLTQIIFMRFFVFISPNCIF